jgi:Xaa-Pro aminopeptidase
MEDAMVLRKAPDPPGYELFGPDPTFPDVPYAEWKSRIDRAQVLMKEKDIDILMLWSEQNCRYFGGFTSNHWMLPSIQPMVTLIPKDGNPVNITGEFFRWAAEAQCWIRDIRTQADVHETHSERAFPKEVADTVSEMGYGKGNVALEMGQIAHTWIPRPFNDIQTMMQALPNAKFVDGDVIVWGCRMIKSTLEIERLKKAAAIHRQAQMTAVSRFKPGMTEQDVGRTWIIAAFENGADFINPGHIMVGAKEGMFDTGFHFEGVTIKKGDYLSLDQACRYKGYWADNGRMVDVGPVSEGFIKGCQVMYEAFDAGVGAARPGTKAKDVWAAVAGVVEKAGMGTIEMVGHGIGLDVQEPPVLGRSEETVLQPGMVFEIEPTGMGQGGMRKFGGVGTFHFENLVIINEKGNEVVMGLPKDVYEVPFAFK